MRTGLWPTKQGHGSEVQHPSFQAVLRNWWVKRNQGASSTLRIKGYNRIGNNMDKNLANQLGFWKFWRPISPIDKVLSWPIPLNQVVPSWHSSFIWQPPKLVNKQRGWHSYEVDIFRDISMACLNPAWNKIPEGYLGSMIFWLNNHYGMMAVHLFR